MFACYIGSELLVLVAVYVWRERIIMANVGSQSCHSSLLATRIGYVVWFIWFHQHIYVNTTYLHWNCVFLTNFVHWYFVTHFISIPLFPFSVKIFHSFSSSHHSLLCLTDAVLKKMRSHTYSFLKFLQCSLLNMFFVPVTRMILVIIFFDGSVQFWILFCLCGTLSNFLFCIGGITLYLLCVRVTVVNQES